MACGSCLFHCGVLSDLSNYQARRRPRWERWPRAECSNAARLRRCVRLRDHVRERFVAVRKKQPAVWLEGDWGWPIGSFGRRRIFVVVVGFRQLVTLSSDTSEKYFVYA